MRIIRRSPIVFLEEPANELQSDHSSPVTVLPERIFASRISDGRDSGRKEEPST